MKKRKGYTWLSLRERFNLQHRVDTETGCWEWTGTKIHTGYGQLTDNYKKKSAHRASYELHIGPIPDGLYVCHTCDNPGCVCPDHLFVGTNTDNLRDMAKKGRSTRGEKSATAKLCELDVWLIRNIEGHTCAMAEFFGVHRNTILSVRTRQSWKHI